MVFADVFKRNDTVGQISRCTFDVHAQDIMGILIIGGTLIMLRPGGILDFEYLAEIFKKKQITYIQTVPSLLQSFFTFLIETHNSNDITCLRSLCTSGE
jgi:non-ribosomal peptide synthetase component F